MRHCQGDVFNCQPFGAALVTALDADRLGGDIEQVGNIFNNGTIGPAFHRRGGDGEFQRPAVQAGKANFGGTRLDINGQKESPVFLLGETIHAKSPLLVRGVLLVGVYGRGRRSGFMFCQHQVLIEFFQRMADIFIDGIPQVYALKQV